MVTEDSSSEGSDSSDPSEGAAKPSAPKVTSSSHPSEERPPSSGSGGDSSAGEPAASKPFAKGGPDLGDFSMAKLISIAALLLATLVIGVLFFRVMASFFVPLFLAALLVVIFRPLHEAITTRFIGRPRLTSILTTITILLLVLLPCGAVGFVAIAQGVDFFRAFRGDAFQQSLDRIRSHLSLDLPKAEQFRQLNGLLDDLADPGPLEPMRDRVSEAEQLVAYLTESLGGPELSEPDEQPTDDDELPVSPAEALLDELAGLIQRGEEWAQSREREDSIAKQDASDSYRSQHWRVRDAHETWVRSLIGDSSWSKLRLLANPSEAELMSLVTGAQEYLQPRVLPFTQIAGKVMLQTMIDLGILVIAVYFFFADGPAMIRGLMRLSPLDESYVRRLLTQFDQTSRAVVLATVLSALAQAVMATFGFWLCGLSSLVMLFLATAFMALIPFLGPAVVWGPVAIYLGAIEGRWFAAVMLVLFGATIVSTVDNVVRVYVLQGNSQLHPLLALLSVLGGLQVFGPIGILVGPMVVVFLQTLLEILSHVRRGLRTDLDDESAPLHSEPPIGHSEGSA